MLRLAIVGGNWNNTLLDGPFYANLNNTASNTNTNNGAAQSYLSFDDSQRNATYIVTFKVTGGLTASSAPLGENKLGCKHLLVAKSRTWMRG